MSKALSDSNSLFLLMRSHSQIQYFLKIDQTLRAANQRGICQSESPAANVAEIHAIPARRRG